MAAMPLLTRAALALNGFSQRWIPSAFAISGLLTGVVFALALLLTPATLSGCVEAWGSGVWALLEFAMQMCLIMVTGSLLAESPALRRGLDALARVPTTPRGAVVWLAFLSMSLCWLHWGLGLIASAFLARRLAARHPTAHYPLLVAVAYWGMGTVWHAGLSGSAPLLVATPKHFMEAKVGLIPLADTIFSPFNLALVAATFALMLALAWALYPEEARGVDPKALESFAEPPPAPVPSGGSFSARLERSWALNGALGLLGLAWLALDASRAGPALTFNKLNLLFFSCALLAYPSPAAFSAAAERAASYVHGIIVQFPLYAGVYGVIKGAGLDALLAGWFVDLAGPRAFPLVMYWYSGVLNYFIPSGGSKWAVEAPYVLEAARTLDVPYAKVVLAYAWGDMLTDLLQPFFCLPLLAIAKVEFREILGYEMIAFLACGALGSAAFWLI